MPETDKYRETTERNQPDGMALWRGDLAVEGASHCSWTVRLLKRLGRFQSAMEAFYRGQPVSPFMENAGEQFLFKTSANPDPLVAAMARLELALMRMAEGSTDEYLVEWERDPEALFQALRSGGELPPPQREVRYRTYISRAVPELVSCEREEKLAADLR